MADITPDQKQGRRQIDHLVDEALRLLRAHDMAGFAALWAPDGILEIPFAPDGPTTIRGRAGVASYLEHYTEIIDVRALVSQRRHHTEDVNTVVLEFSTDCTVLATGAPLVMSYIAVITAGAEGIVSYRDYWNPMAAAQALGPDTPLARGEQAGAR